MISLLYLWCDDQAVSPAWRCKLLAHIDLIELVGLINQRAHAAAGSSGVVLCVVDSQVDGPLQTEWFSGPADVFVAELSGPAARPAGGGATGRRDGHLWSLVSGLYGYTTRLVLLPIHRGCWSAPNYLDYLDSKRKLSTLCGQSTKNTVFSSVVSLGPPLPGEERVSGRRARQRPLLVGRRNRSGVTVTGGPHFYVVT